MRSPLALVVAALFLGAFPARAIECKPGAFQEASLAPVFAPSSPPTAYNEYLQKYTSACSDLKDKAEDALYTLKALSDPTPDQLAEIKKHEKTVEDVKAAYADAVKASEAAQKLPPGSSVLQRFGAMESRFPTSQNIKFLSDMLINAPYEPPEPRDDDGKSLPKKETEVKSTIASTIEREAMNGPVVDPQKLAMAGKIFSGAGQNEATARVAQELIASAPADARGPNLAARAALMANHPEDAAEWARKALSLDPSSGEARRMLGFATSLLSKSRLKNGPASKPGFEETAGEAAGGPGPGSNAGLRSANAGSQGAAAPGARPAGIPAPHLPRHLTGAQGKAAVGDFAGAYDDLTRALTLFPDDDAARAMRAEIALAIDNPEAALADAEQLLAKNPKDARAMRAKASALLQLGRLDEALATVDRAILLEVLAASGHLIRAQILEKMGRAADAAAEYREAARLDPALTPVAQEALRRLGFGPAAPEGAGGRKLLVRGAVIALALSLLLAGLLRTRRAGDTTTGAAAK